MGLLSCTLCSFYINSEYGGKKGEGQASKNIWRVTEVFYGIGWSC